MPRRFPIVQFPNPPLIAALAAALVAYRTRGASARAATLASRVALAVWSWAEITDGANWFRRMIGLAGAGAAAHGLVQLARGDARPDQV